MTGPGREGRPPPIGWRGEGDDRTPAPRPGPTSTDGDAGATRPADPSPRPGWRTRLFGDRDRLGWWLLPMFLAVGLAGAVLAGSLAVVYASQRVDRLTRETAGARADLANALEDVEEAAAEALSTIREEVEAVRDVLSMELPYDDAAEIGIVHLAVDVEVPVAPQQRQAPPPEQEPDEAEGEEAEDGAEQPDTRPEPEPQPPPEPPLVVRRRATGFVVARDGGDAFVATTFALVSDPRRPEVPLDVGVALRVAGGDTTARLHSWDAEQDLVLLRAGLGNVEPLPWRPEDAPLAGGERIVAIGLTPGLGPVRVGGTVALADPVAVVSDVPPLELLAGGPVVDAEGRVVAVGSVTHNPYGGDPVAIPIRRLCERLLSRCPD